MSCASSHDRSTKRVQVSLYWRGGSHSEPDNLLKGVLVHKGVRGTAAIEGARGMGQGGKVLTFIGLNNDCVCHSAYVLLCVVVACLERRKNIGQTLRNPPRYSMTFAPSSRSRQQHFRTPQAFRQRAFERKHPSIRVWRNPLPVCVPPESLYEYIQVVRAPRDPVRV